MTTIDTRAKEYADKQTYLLGDNYRKLVASIYKEAAQEQRTVDIEKLTEYAENFNKQNEELEIDARIDVESLRMWAFRTLCGDEFDEYLMSKIEQATPIWKDVDVEEYIRQFRE